MFLRIIIKAPGIQNSENKQMFMTKQKWTDGGNILLCHIPSTTTMALGQRRWTNCGTATGNR